MKEEKNLSESRCLALCGNSLLSTHTSLFLTIAEDDDPFLKASRKRMSVIPNVTHIHYTAYADPVIRPASPASSVGTAYGPDQTAFSDLEEQIAQPSFESKWEDLIGLHHPRKEELVADRDPLLSVPGPNGQLIPIREKKLDPLEEKSLLIVLSFLSCLSNLCSKCFTTGSWLPYDLQ